MITKKVLNIISLSTLFIAGCSNPPSAIRNDLEDGTNNITQTASASQPSESKTVLHTSVSLARAYNTVGDLTYGSALVAEVKILGIDHIDASIDSTFYKAIIQDVVKQREDRTKKDQIIIIKQTGIETEEEKKGTVEVDREDPLMKVGDEYVLFLKEHPSVANTFYISGSYQGKYKIQDKKVYSIDQEPGIQRNVKGEDLIDFKNSIKEMSDTKQ